ncbi:hypothetical protein DFH08DRAFT_807194 [Mycena albidolilacea]|uniref:Uncharacterized protein n=1 Tax=Mycena albidolilacea TaxID=1033008 RepID=A0AAD7A5D7_9AGAR|nr:hypothetical protein DFH08DRAFT_807194 [Mycena albidolilacea]
MHYDISNAMMRSLGPRDAERVRVDRVDTKTLPNWATTKICLTPVARRRIHALRPRRDRDALLPIQHTAVSTSQYTIINPNHQVLRSTAYSRTYQLDRLHRLACGRAPPSETCTCKISETSLFFHPISQASKSLCPTIQAAVLSPACQGHPYAGRLRAHLTPAASLTRLSLLPACDAEPTQARSPPPSALFGITQPSVSARPPPDSPPGDEAHAHTFARAHRGMPIRRPPSAAR